MFSGCLETKMDQLLTMTGECVNNSVLLWSRTCDIVIFVLPYAVFILMQCFYRYKTVLMFYFDTIIMCALFLSE